MRMNFSLIIYGIIGYLIYDTFLKGKTESEQFSDLIKPQSNLSYPLYAYKEMVSKLFNAMDGFATDEDAIYQVIYALKRDEDVRQLKKDWGLKDYTGNNLEVMSFMIDDPQPLTAWLSAELDEEEKRKVRYILKSNNVNEFLV